MILRVKKCHFHYDMQKIIWFNKSSKNIIRKKFFKLLTPELS
jgi:hypothetical protein